ncbi:unnamed protein product [Blepharisma stoltei]|uniref:RING-type domain-containing protein n=1 Tax=Blepharisma stoltei TaxID=1481888 RepID=A0AAU9JFP3_9CILI|nr:unnamed protein product [Blepharisma stoltei]
MTNFWFLLIFSLFFEIFCFAMTLDINQTIKITQLTEWNDFPIQLVTSNITDTYIAIKLEIIERQFQSFPLLYLGINFEPDFDSHINQPKFNYSDYQSFLNQEETQWIILQYDSKLSSSSLYIGIWYENFTNGPIQYSLSFFQSNKPICPSMCSGNGQCKNLGKCSCYSSYVGNDCETTTFSIGFNESRWVDVKSDDKTYLKSDAFQWGSDVVLKCSLSYGEAVLYIGFPTNDTSNLPNKESCAYTLYLSQDIRFIHKSIKTSNSYGFLIIGIFNTLKDSGNTLSVKCYLSHDNSSSSKSTNMVIVYALVGISISIFALWVIGFIIKCRWRRHAVDNEHSPMGITKESIESLFPSFNLKNIDDADIPMCMICLEDYNPKSKVRKLGCGHIFHMSCIDEWFRHHKICCLCKRDCESVNNSVLPENIATFNIEQSRNLSDSFTGLIADELNNEE